MSFNRSYICYWWGWYESNVRHVDFQSTGLQLAYNPILAESTGIEPVPLFSASNLANCPLTG
jgi:hypothetical protein